MRLFLAIELPEDVRRHLSRVQQALAPMLPEAAMTRPENLHVTLKFIGQVDDRRTIELCESLSMIKSAPIELSARGVECFPSRGPIRIVAADMAGSIAALRAMHQAIEQRCKYLGFEKEGRDYRPHVTLGRARRPVRQEIGRRAADEEAKLFPGPGFNVTEFVLMESRLNPKGSEYAVAARFQLTDESQA